MDLQQIYKLKQIAEEMLKEPSEPLDEAYHAKDRSARKEISDNFGHHSNMADKHRVLLNMSGKDKDAAKHDLAMMSHNFAQDHYGRMMGNLPQDFHEDREFYDKLGGMISKRANGKSKECGVDCEGK